MTRKIPSGPFYTAAVVCRVCGISQRKLDYWVSTGVISLSRVWQRKDSDKATFVFTREEIGLLRLVAQFRAAGLPLQRIRWALARIQRGECSVSKGSYLVTDGKSIYELTDNPNVALKISRGEYGQQVMTAVALGRIWMDVMERLTSPNIRPISERSVQECLRPWRTRVVGG